MKEFMAEKGISIPNVESVWKEKEKKKWMETDFKKKTNDE